MEDKFDCIIVGGGVAGLSAALRLAKADLKFLLVERGAYSGAKNVSGGVLWGTDLAELVPDYWTQEDVGFERFITHRRLSFLDQESAFSIDFKSDHFRETPYRGLVVLRAKFDTWLATQVQAAIDAGSHAEESFLAYDVLVDAVLQENGQVNGIRAGGEEFYADTVIIAEGVNNLLTRQVGLQSDYVPAEGLATGVKEIIRFDQQVLEDRFQLNGLSGMSNEFVGFASQGVEGGGFLYTNRTTLSIGVVLSIADLRKKGRRPHEILNDFKAHPAVADMLRGGEVVEYSAHVVSTGDMRVMPREVYADGVLIVGEAANLVLNSGKAIQGMDYAMRSGILAADTVVEAREKGDFSAATLKSYRAALERSYVMQDLRSFQGAVNLLHSPTMFTEVPAVLCDFGRNFFTIESQPTQKAGKLLRGSIKAHSSYWALLKVGLKAARAL